MNTANNKRRQETILKLQKAYMSLAVSRVELQSITVSDVCKKADVNRTTFYAIFFDLSELSKSVEELMLQEFLGFFPEEVKTASHSMDFNKLFSAIQENQIFFKLYFKLGFDFGPVFLDNDRQNLAASYFPNPNTLSYHITFFSAGITAIIKKWLNEGCPGKPEHMGQILAEEYQKKNTF